MLSEARIEPDQMRTHDAGNVWYELHAEREFICEALLGKPATMRFAEDDVVSTDRMQARLRMIDDALDRLMSGSYGDCVKCGRWIDDAKLHSDAAFPFCASCEHEPFWPQEILHQVKPVRPNESRSVGNLVPAL